MRTDKTHTQIRRMRKALKLKRSDLAALAGVSCDTLARLERGKKISLVTQDQVSVAIFRVVAKRNPEAVNQAVQPALEAAEKWERILSLEPGSELALKVEELNGKSLAELKIHAETVSGFLRSVAKIGLSLAE